VLGGQVAEHAGEITRYRSQVPVTGSAPATTSPRLAAAGIMSYPARRRRRAARPGDNHRMTADQEKRAPMNAYSRAPAGQALAQALDLLGWSGHLVVQARALSEPRLVACTWDQPAHDRRAGAGILPVTDPLLLRCALSEPRFRAAPVPARITGAIAIRRTWRAAVTNLTGFAAFGALVAVLPDAQAGRLEVTAEASVTGIGVIGAGQARLVQHPDLRPRPGTGTWVHRLVAEIIYDAALAARAGHAGLPPPLTSSAHGLNRRCRLRSSFRVRLGAFRGLLTPAGCRTHRTQADTRWLASSPAPPSTSP
jgi:hypothetical protein